MNNISNLERKRKFCLGLFLVGAMLATQIGMAQSSDTGKWVKKTALENEERRNREMALVVELHKRIVANHRDMAEADMKKYEVDLPGAGIAFIYFSQTLFHAADQRWQFHDGQPKIHWQSRGTARA